MAQQLSDARVITAHKPLRQQLAGIWAYRSLLLQLVRKELKVKYKNSTLGFVWSLFNPAMYLVVFFVVFEIVLRAGIPNFAIFILAGLLVWNLFLTSVAGSTTAITGNASLIHKVYFAREVLPLATVGAALVHFFLQSIVLVLALGVLQHPVSPAHLAMVPLALLVLLTLAAGLGLMTAALNVYLRDVQHIVELALILWFWMTPIVYQVRLVTDRLDASNAWIAYLNPLTTIVVTFQRGIYNVVATDTTAILPESIGAGWYLTRLGGVGLFSLGVLLGSLWVFRRIEGRFAEEL